MFFNKLFRRQQRLLPFDRWLQQELAAISTSEIEGPKEPVQEGETVVGVIDSAEMRKLYTFKHHLQLKLNLILIRIASKSSCEEESVIAFHRLKIVDDIFWANIRLMWPEVNDHDVAGVREGFKVVYCEHDHGSVAEKCRSCPVKNVCRSRTLQTPWLEEAVAG